MEWYKSASTVRPSETDITSSKKYNYVRKNIIEEVVTEGNETYTLYVYEEAKIRKEDWGLYLDNVQQRADIDYIATMTDIEL